MVLPEIVLGVFGYLLFVVGGLSLSILLIPFFYPSNLDSLGTPRGSSYQLREILLGCSEPPNDMVLVHANKDVNSRCVNWQSVRTSTTENSRRKPRDRSKNIQQNTK